MAAAQPSGAARAQGTAPPTFFFPLLLLAAAMAFASLLACGLGACANTTRWSDQNTVRHTCVGAQQRKTAVPWCAAAATPLQRSPRL